MEHNDAMAKPQVLTLIEGEKKCSHMHELLCSAMNIEARASDTSFMFVVSIFISRSILGVLRIFSGPRCSRHSAINDLVAEVQTQSKTRQLAKLVHVRPQSTN